MTFTIGTPVTLVNRDTGITCKSTVSRVSSDGSFTTTFSARKYSPAKIWDGKSDMVLAGLAKNVDFRAIQVFPAS